MWHGREMMKEIKLTKRKITKVFNKDFWLNGYNWFASLNGTKNHYYAIRTATVEERQKGAPTMIKMHRQIMGLVYGDPKDQIDHINGDSLDNRRSNLQIITNRKNISKGHRRSKYGLGVRCDKRCALKPYYMRIDVHGTRINGRYRATPEEAQQDYADALQEHGLV